jgi:hypothetical protein
MILSVHVYGRTSDYSSLPVEGRQNKPLLWPPQRRFEVLCCTAMLLLYGGR